MIRRIRTLLHITRSHVIARRYFVVNGFDGALAMLGLIVGFEVSDSIDVPVVINVCLGTAIALGVSGVSSAYVSEAAEKQRELRELERAMLADLKQTNYGLAARVLPPVIGLVNGSAPFFISLLIITPMWLAESNVPLPLAPLQSALCVAIAIMFLLGTYIGRISGGFWLWAGLRTLLIAGITALLIYLVAPG